MNSKKLTIFIVTILLSGIAKANFVDLPFYDLELKPGMKIESFYNISNQKNVKCEAYAYNNQKALRLWWVSWKSQDVGKVQALAYPVLLNNNNATPYGLFYITWNGDWSGDSQNNIKLTCAYV